MNMPDSYTNLKYIQRLFVDCYLNEFLVEPNIGKNTFSDKFVSYVFAKNIDVNDFMIIQYFKDGGFGKVVECKEYTQGASTKIRITNPKMYMSINSLSTKMYNQCIQAINDIRVLLYESEDKSRVLELKDAIYNSSLHSDDSKDRNENRKMAMKYFGLDQVKVDISADIYSASGKNILQTLSKQSTNRDDAPIIPQNLEDLVNDVEA